MKYLVIDNFRGFKETIIPIRDVNFLVGENSTGKTSLLDLMEIITDRYFWIQHRFKTDEIDLGAFDDIVSVFAEDRSYFRVGMLELDHDEESKKEGSKKEQKCSGFLATFKSREGMPSISRYTLIHNNQRFDARFTGKNVLYRRRPIEKKGIKEEQCEKMIYEWIEDHKIIEKGFRTLKAPDHVKTNIGGLNYIFDHMSRDEVLREEDPFKVGFPRYFEFPRRIAPIRAKPDRTYDKHDYEYSPEGYHTPYVIKKYINDKILGDKFVEYLNDFGLESGLFDGITIKKFGRNITAPFELEITLSRKKLNIINVGYGVSQALPVIVELFLRPMNSCYFIQQPEIHLHPRAQAALGSLLFQLWKAENKTFLIETHSDFIIDRFRMHYKKEEETKKPSSQVIYFERNLKGNKAYIIPISEDGKLPKNQPKGYRNFFLKEDLSGLGY